MYSLREGQKSDLPRVLELIKELALYEKAPEQVTNTLERMEKEGFGPQPVYGFFVCVKDSSQELIGIAVYYYRYSTWKGKRLYLEDIVVTETERGNGAGKLLFDRVMAKSLEERMQWHDVASARLECSCNQLLQKYDALLEAGWLNAHLQDYEIKKLLQS
jgi:L-amino acid N-acyltransferase YncA